MSKPLLDKKATRICAMVLRAFIVPILMVPAFPISAYATPTTCDASTAIGYVKRLEGPRGGVTIARVGGAIITDPAPLTYICPMDNIATSGAAIAHVAIYDAMPVVVRSFSPWKPVRQRPSGNMRSNIWAMVTDKFMPDLGRVETTHAVRGGSLDPTVARVPGVRAGTDVLPLEELGGVIRLPVYGELWLGQAQLRGPSGVIRPSRDVEGQDIVFDAAGLLPGKYEVVVTKAPTGRLPPPSRSLGTFTLVAGRGPTLEAQGRNPYAPEVVVGLRALWLADTHGERHGLLAYQLATRARIEAIPPEQVAELVLKTLSSPSAQTTPTSIER